MDIDLDNAKNILQYYCQTTKQEFPVYNSIKEGKPPNEVFRCSLTIGSSNADGYGKTKKAAEKEVAFNMCNILLNKKLLMIPPSLVNKNVVGTVVGNGKIEVVNGNSVGNVNRNVNGNSVENSVGNGNGKTEIIEKESYIFPPLERKYIPPSQVCPNLTIQNPHLYKNQSILVFLKKVDITELVTLDQYIIILANPDETYIKKTCILLSHLETIGIKMNINYSSICKLYQLLTNSFPNRTITLI